MAWCEADNFKWRCNFSLKNLSIFQVFQSPHFVETIERSPSANLSSSKRCQPIIFLRTPNSKSNWWNWALQNGSKRRLEVMRISSLRFIYRMNWFKVIMVCFSNDVWRVRVFPSFHGSIFKSLISFFVAIMAVRRKWRVFMFIFTAIRSSTFLLKTRRYIRRKLISVICLRLFIEQLRSTRIDTHKRNYANLNGFW